MTAAKRHRRSNQAGFTLLELLIALSLLSLIVVFVLGSLRFGRRAWEVADRLDQTVSVAAAQLYLRDTLARAEPIGIPDAQGRLQLAFQGTSSSLTFVANLEGYTTAAGLHEIAIDRREPSSLSDHQHGAVALNMFLFRPAAKSGDRPKPIEVRDLVTNVGALRFRYFGRLKDTDQPSWRDNWQGAFRLPDLIAINLAFAPGDPRSWPELIVAPQLH